MTLTFPFTVVLLFGDVVQILHTDAPDAHAAGHRYTHDPQTGNRFLDAKGLPDARVVAVFAGHHTNQLTSP